MSKHARTYGQDYVERRHKCESCGRVYVCDGCSAAMNDAGGSGNLHRHPVYCRAHQPIVSRASNNTSMEPWHCEKCEQPKKRRIA